MSDTDDPTRPAVPAVARAVRMLEVVAESDGMTLTELSRAIGAPKSSCLAVCTTLVESGMLVRTAGGTYRLGLKVVQLGRSYLSRSDIAAEFRRVDGELGLLADDTIVLSVLNGREVTYVDTRHGRRPVAVHYEIGMRLPAHCTASGKSLLAALPPGSVGALYADARFDTLTPHSIDSLRELRPELDRVRTRGYAVDDEETALGMICFGVAVLGPGGGPAGAISVSMVKAAVDGIRAASAAHAILRLAQTLTVRLGGPPREIPVIDASPWAALLP
ncbi:IclR family transcriptional regulator [Pseudonocardia sp. TRM90224]|uniref:IclR family transcriptional regulator n=1 Tax=Pseudonocardia sp. TRM90224 TaxID=2812678 RepID=UPI001E28ADBB|nr:IclR family transcriptional regulator [Pseudonocardia sp. TRM90224]